MGSCSKQVFYSSVKTVCQIFSIGQQQYANVSLKGYNIYCCLAALSVAVGGLFLWLLWSSLDSTDIIIQMLNLQNQLWKTDKLSQTARFEWTLHYYYYYNYCY